MSQIDNAPELLTIECSSVDEAKHKASKEWGLKESEVKATVVGEEKSFFGLFGKKLIVQVEPLFPVNVRMAKSALEKLFDLMNFSLDIDLEGNPEGAPILNVTGTDDSYLVGKYGDAIKSMDLLVNLMIRNDGPMHRVRISSKDYRENRQEELEKMALRVADDAYRARRTIYLQPMASWERRFIHLILKDSDKVETHSIGVEPDRKVAIRPKLAPGMEEERPRNDRPRDRGYNKNRRDDNRSSGKGRDNNNRDRKPSGNGGGSKNFKDRYGKKNDNNKRQEQAQ